MATTQEREDFKEIMEKVVNIVQGQTEIARSEGQNVEYKGIWSIADYIARYYIENYYTTEECEYILYKKEQMLVIDLASYLSRNWSKFAPDGDSDERGRIKQFDFKTALDKINTDLYDFKRKLYWAWVGGKLDTEFRDYITKNVDLITEERKLRYMFCKEYRQFKANRVTEFKKAVGLKGDKQL